VPDNPVEGDQAYVAPPDALRVTLSPIHIVDNAGVTAIGGIPFVLIKTVAVFVQPLELVPVTVYVVGTVGVAVTTGPVVGFNVEVGDQLYEVPPEAVNVVEVPKQIDESAAVALIEGRPLTVTVAVAVLAQPFELDPVTVYVVVEFGETGNVLPVAAPGFHWYVPPIPAPAAVSTDEAPGQIVAGFAVAVITGNGFTVIIDVDVFEQPLPSVPVTVYVVVAVGLTFTDVPARGPGVHV
jgi:hypothetical protein